MTPRHRNNEKILLQDIEVYATEARNRMNHIIQDVRERIRQLEEGGVGLDGANKT